MAAAKKKSKAAEARKNTFDEPAPVITRSTTMPEGLTIKRTITVPSLVLKVVGEGAALRFDSAMRISTIQQKAGEGKQMDPATIANVTDVKTGEQFIFLVPSLVKSNLQNNYPDDGYNGKAFWICNKGKRKPSQRYNDFEIQEVEVTK